MSYIYLILEREFIKTNENIYKIGRSNQNNDKRIKQYPNNSKLILQTICSDCHFSENKIISLFKTKYIHRNDIGHEYFEGDVFEMRKDINKIIDEFDKLSIDELQKRAKEQIIENKLNKDLEKQILLKKKQEEIEFLNKKKENVKKELLEELEYIERKKNELEAHYKDLLKKADAAVREKKYEEALSYYNEAILIHPENEFVQFRIKTLEFQLSKLKEGSPKSN
jgi:tetratricopeptide (TPR) repeat protein